VCQQKNGEGGQIDGQVEVGDLIRGEAKLVEARDRAIPVGQHSSCNLMDDYQQQPQQQQQHQHHHHQATTPTTKRGGTKVYLVYCSLTSRLSGILVVEE